MKVVSHAGTVVPECFKDDNAVNGKVGNSTPAPSETPEPIVTKPCMDDYVVDPYPYAKFHHDTITPLCAKTKFYISTPFYPKNRKFLATFRRDIENFASKSP